MKFGVALAAGAALLAIASCGEANKALAPITAAEVNGAAIIAAPASASKQASGDDAFDDLLADLDRMTGG